MVVGAKLQVQVTDYSSMSYDNDWWRHAHVLQTAKRLKSTVREYLFEGFFMYTSISILLCASITWCNFF